MSEKCQNKFQTNCQKFFASPYSYPPKGPAVKNHRDFTAGTFDGLGLKI